MLPRSTLVLLVTNYTLTKINIFKAVDQRVTFCNFEHHYPTSHMAKGVALPPNHSGKKAKNRTNPASERPGWFFFWSSKFWKFSKKHKGGPRQIFENFRPNLAPEPSLPPCLSTYDQGQGSVFKVQQCAQSIPHIENPHIELFWWKLKNIKNRKIAIFGASCK